MPIEEEESAGIPEWVVTFGDMMSLLLTFFVLLFSMSEIKQEESFLLLQSLRKQFGNQRSMISPMTGKNPPMNSNMRALASMGRAQRANTMNGGDKVRAPVGDNPRVTTIHPSNDTTLGGVVYFQEGSAELANQQKQQLDVIADSIRGKLLKIRIGGHTTRRPLGPDSPYKTLRDLANARCRVVENYLSDLNVNPQRFRPEIVAANEPIYVGRDSERRKKNARVEVLLLPESSEGLLEPEPASEPPEQDETK